MKLVLLIFLLAFPLIIKADQPRYNTVFTSANGKFELKYEKGNEWLLREIESDKEIYRLTGNWLDSMTVLVSDDGKSVVSIDDYSTQDYEDNPEILTFFHNGQKVKSYKLDEIYDNSKFITVSVSHFRWAFGYEKTFSIKDSKLNLTTYEMNNYLFNVETGEVLKKERDESLLDGAVYVYGKIKGLGGDKHEIQVDCVIYGSADKGKKILFDSKKFRWEGSGFDESIIIKDGKLIARKGVHFNMCN